MRSILLAIVLLLGFSSQPLSAATILNVDVWHEFWCYPGAGCGEVFSTSHVESLDEEHVGNLHSLSTKILVCDPGPFGCAGHVCYGN